MYLCKKVPWESKREGVRHPIHVDMPLRWDPSQQKVTHVTWGGS